MNAAKGSIRCLLASVLLAVAGCSTSRVADAPSTDTVHFQSMATQIEYPAGPTPCDGSLANTPPPRTIRDPSQVEYRDLRLQEVIQTALMNSRVLIDLGGTVLRAPESVQTSYSIAVEETDPEYGPEAALERFRRPVLHQPLLPEEQSTVQQHGPRHERPAGQQL